MRSAVVDNRCADEGVGETGGDEGVGDGGGGERVTFEDGEQEGFGFVAGPVAQIE